MPQTTHLAAIMVTDIIGYSELIKTDREKALQFMLKNKTIQDPLIEKHHGRWLGGMKDGSWVSFSNTLDAVTCAREIQATMKLQSAFNIRVSIHLGEVTDKENEILGEALYATSELRSQDGESGVFISEAIFNTIRNNQAIHLSGLNYHSTNNQNTASPVQEAPETEELSMDNSLLQNLRNAVMDNMDNEQFGVEDLASEVSLSRSHLHRKLQQLTGQSISQHIRSIRLEKSMELLQKDVATISEIAYRVGFGSPTYFIKCFHEHYGYPPGEVKKRLGQNLEESGEIVTEYKEERTIRDEAEPIRLYQVKDTWNKTVHNRIRATILRSDLSGFSKLLSEDEVKAGNIRENNKKLHQDLFREHNGNWLMEVGDSIIGYFMEPKDALDCAIKINNSSAHNICIGLNLGNLVIDQDEIYGEGLNVVSRLIEVAIPGSVILSQRVIDELGSQEIPDHKYLGSFNFRGITRSAGIYALNGETFSVPDESNIMEVLKPSEIEGLQEHQSRHFIEEIFQEMMRVKKDIAGNLGDKPDVRIIAHHIIRNYPWPISVELRRLFSASLREISLRRLLQLVKTIDRILKLLTFILVTELHDKRMKGQLEDLSSNEFDRHLKQMGPENILWLLQKISVCFRTHKLDYYMEEMKEVFDKELFGKLEEWALEKENILESGPDLNDDQLSDKCDSNEKLLVNLLKRLAFMIKYRLVNIGSIKVHKSKYKQPKFEHSIDILNSPDSEFRTREEILQKFSDSNAVLIMKDIRDPDSFLNLSPLVIDTHHEQIDAKSKMKRDIFLYEKFRSGKMLYTGTEVTEKIDLGEISNYEALLEEFDEIIENLKIRPE